MEHSFTDCAVPGVILAMAWWKWPLLALGGLVVLAVLAVKYHRRAVRKHLIRYMRENHPEIEIVSEHSSHLMIRTSSGAAGQMNLYNLFSQIAETKAKTPEDERAIFKTMIAGLIENLERAARPMSVESDGDFLLPRLVNGGTLAQLMANAKIANQPLAGTGLSVVYVRDSDNAVSYLAESALEELHLDIPALHERALVNLRKKSSATFAREVLGSKSLALLKLGDTFDAARLLLVPEQLQDGDVLAAVIPDRDTLALAPPPADGDWSGLTKLSRVTSGPALLNRPLRVTRNGFELMG